MGSQFRQNDLPSTVVVLGGKEEKWLEVLESGGWHCQPCADLRKLDTLLHDTGPCIGVLDLSKDEFSLNGIANLVSRYKYVRWIAFIKEHQLQSNTICQFIVNFCIDFFTAPMPDAQLMSTIGHQRGMLRLEKKVWPNYGCTKSMGLTGESVSMKRLREQIKRIGSTDVSILIYGENGSGKESVAKAIHNVSSRSKQPFITVNCRAMSEERIESELFGVGRRDDSPSLLEQAHGGTLYLNEILTLPRSQQRRLLHFIQEGTYETENGIKELDVRVLAGYSSDIEKALTDKNFNEELYHHINVLRINVPSLKERASDIPLLAKKFLQEYSKEHNTQVKDLSDQALKVLVQYNWPGNVPELMNQIKRAVLMSDSAIIDVGQLDLPQLLNGKRSLKSIRESSEKEALVMALELYDGQVSLAAKVLGISRATMYRLLNKHDLISEATESV